MNKLFICAIAALALAGAGCETPRPLPPPPPPQGAIPGPADIKMLAKAGMSDEVIISQIRNSRVIYRLTTDDVLDLKSHGVSEKVIDFMINTPSLYPPPPPPPRY